MQDYCLQVEGPFACFTRPEMKVERVSYDVITPSSARSIFEAILWKPAIRWRVHTIEILKPISWINLRRNEVSTVLSTRNVLEAMHAGHGQLSSYIEEDRQQRAGLLLRNVAYRLHARMELITTEAQKNPAKYYEMFERRAVKGQCVNQPYFGCREFSASFRLIQKDESVSPRIQENRRLGYMLHDLDFSNPNDPQPRFFEAELRDGVLHVPSFEDTYA